MTKPRWHVQLGPTWSRFSAPRTDLQLLGTVQHGPQIGALGKMPDGCYVQVNGDVLSPVNTHKVQVAINAAMQRQRTRKPLKQSQRLRPHPKSPSPTASASSFQATPSRLEPQQPIQRR